MQICDTQSHNTERDQMASLLSSSPPSNVDPNEYYRRHMAMVMECLGGLAITPASPISTAIPFDKVFVANIDHSQRHLKWDLPDDVWTDDIESWLQELPQWPVEVHPCPGMYATEISRWSTSSTASETSSETQWKRIFPSFELPQLDLFTDVFWQVPSEYSPSIYSQDDFGFNEVPRRALGDAAHELMQEVADAPINYISLHDILSIMPQMQAICSEINATVNRAEDSAEFDSSDDDSNSDVSSLDLNAPTPAISFYRLACPETLSNSISSPPGSNGSTDSYVRVRVRHSISPDIQNRLAHLANSGLNIQTLRSSVHDFALPTDETDAEN